jgi:hypothetical protein
MNPNGTKEFPARDCYNLFKCNPDFKDGKYWVDPNLGCNEDAMEVECRKTTRKICTCLSCPFERDVSSPDTWTMRDNMEVKFSNMRDGFKVTCARWNYAQYNFMRLLSTSAYQYFRYNCVNSRADLTFVMDNNRIPDGIERINDGCEVIMSVVNLCVCVCVCVVGDEHS